jgi:hypothetical protein
VTIQKDVTYDIEGTPTFYPTTQEGQNVQGLSLHQAEAR